MCDNFCTAYACKECNNDIDVCTKCFDGFYLDNGECGTSNITNCKVCTDATTCAEYYDGYFLDSGLT